MNFYEEAQKLATKLVVILKDNQANTNQRCKHEIEMAEILLAAKGKQTPLTIREKLRESVLMIMPELNQILKEEETH